MAKTKRRYLLEVCVDNVEDALRAEAAGADRLEVCQDLSCGGITPSLDKIELLMQNCALPIVILIRERPGNFVFTDDEKASMLEAVNQFTSLAVEGVAIGSLLQNHEVDLKFMSEVRRVSIGSAVVMHRAFDGVVDYRRSAQDLAAIGIDRILTAGCADRATDGKDVLSDLNERFGHLIDILVAGSVRSVNAQLLLETTCANQIHSSARLSSLEDPRGEDFFSELEVKRLAAIIRNANSSMEQ